MSNEKGGLIKKKKKPTIMQPSVPVKKNDMDFGYTEPQKQEKPALVKSTEKADTTKIAPPTPRKKLGVGKTNSTKSLKVPTLIHSELNLLGSFMDEHKTYVILQNLIDSYVKNELTDRQQRQFDFMVEAFFEDK
ncbi:hypothetical protein [Sporosarcina sp. A2]|uniref:hypothetical protein n=1 Tax=Sporosarcina sp. A2 TaxID=3393449 RepID=UPI003D78F5C9